GLEDAKDIVRLLDHLKIEKAQLVGYSMGATVAARVMIDNPERIKSAVLGGRGPYFEPLERDLRAAEISAEGLDAGKGIGAGIIASIPPGEPALPEELADAFSKFVVHDQDQKALAANVRGQSSLAVTEEQLKANRVPVLFAYGSRDGY